MLISSAASKKKLNSMFDSKLFLFQIIFISEQQFNYEDLYQK